jgi:hypothetical protein
VISSVMVVDQEPFYADLESTLFSISYFSIEISSSNFITFMVKRQCQLRKIVRPCL